MRKRSSSIKSIESFCDCSKIMLLLSFVCMIASILFLYTVWWYYNYLRYKRYLKVFPEFKQVPLFGVIYNVRNTVDIYDTLLSQSRLKGRNMFGMLGPYPCLFTSDPNVFSLILGSQKYIDKPLVYKCLNNAIGNSLLLVNGNEWRQQRRQLNPAFDYANIQQNIYIFNKQSDDLVKVLAEEVNKESTEVHKFVEQWSLLQVYDTMMGTNVNLKEKYEYLEALKCLMKIAIKKCISIMAYFDFTYIFTRNYWLERKMLNIVFPHTTEIIKSGSGIESGSGNVQRERPILIDILLKQMQIDKTITDTYITKQLNLMVGAGFDTTATAACYVLYHMSLYPEIQQKVYQEIFSILGDDITQPITHEHVKDMKYLDLVIKESMRIKSTVPFFLRQLQEDVEFEGTILPKGLTIMLMAYVMHLDPILYPDPEKFIPERFLPNNLNPNRYSYAPYCGGVRNCIGQKYASLALKVVLAKILLNYKLVDAKHELCLATEITLVSKTGIKVGFRKRN